MASWLPGELKHDHVPYPTLILMGCRAWVAVVAAGQPCLVCKGGVRKGHDSAYCARCDSLSPKRESQVLAARVGLRARSASEDAERGARDELRKLRKSAPVLSEAHRRRLWNGYGRNGISSRNPEVANRAKVGRDFLIAIGQEPDFNLILDQRGRVIGRTDAPADDTP